MEARMRTSVIVIFLFVAACSVEQAREPNTDSSSKAPYKTLDLTYDRPAVVGTAVQVAATGLTSGKTVELQWETVTGGWVIEDYYHFKGKKYAETTMPLGKFDVDSAGHLDARFVVP